MQRWREQAPRYRDGGVGREYRLMARAAQWGADMELEACCDHIRNHQWGFIKRPNDDWIHRAVDLEQARRPKPPSLKQQALNDLADAYNADKIDDTTYEDIRLALEEVLPDD